jgi:hypothetical protein
VDAHVEVVGVRVADIDVDLVGDFGPERRPVGLEDVAQIVVVLPVLRDVLVDDARLLVPDALRVTVGANG